MTKTNLPIDIDNIDLSVLSGLSDEEKQLALTMLREYAENGSSSTLDTLIREPWDEMPVDIKTFVHDKKYLGNGLYDQDGRFTLFPY